MYQFIVHKRDSVDLSWQEEVAVFPGIVVVDSNEKSMEVQATYEIMKDLKAALGVDYFKYPPDPCLIGPYAVGFKSERKEYLVTEPATSKGQIPEWQNWLHQNVDVEILSNSPALVRIKTTEKTAELLRGWGLLVEAPITSLLSS